MQEATARLFYHLRSAHLLQGNWGKRGTFASATAQQEAYMKAIQKDSLAKMGESRHGKATQGILTLHAK